MRAFVAGATGYTGQALVRELRAGGADVLAHVRPDSARLEEWRRRFGELGAQVDTTAWEELAVTDALVRIQPTHVFALLGTTRKRVQAARARGGADSYETVDYGLTALLLRATQRAAPRSRFIYLSSVGASEGGNAYIRARGRVERELRESGLSWIAARPAFITGADREESRPLERIAGAAIDVFLKSFAALGIRDPYRRYASLTATQLARALAQVAEHGADGVHDAAALRAAAAQPPSDGRGSRNTSPGSA